MKQYFLLLLVGLSSSFSYAQSQYRDVIYLKNDSIVRGMIIEEVPNVSFKIRSVDNNEHLFQINEIAKIAKEIVVEENTDSINNTGYSSIVEFGFGIAISDYGKERLKFNFINSFELNPYISVGFGAGLRYYFYTENALIPLLVNFRSKFSDGNISPYFAVDLGYSFEVTDNFNPVGLLLSPSAGINFKLSETTSMHLGLGYELQKMPIAHYDNNYYIYRADPSFTTENVGAINIDVGFIF